MDPCNNCSWTFSLSSSWSWSLSSPQWLTHRRYTHRSLSQLLNPVVSGIDPDLLVPLIADSSSLSEKCTPPRPSHPSFSYPSLIFTSNHTLIIPTLTHSSFWHHGHTGPPHLLALDFTYSSHSSCCCGRLYVPWSDSSCCMQTPHTHTSTQNWEFSLRKREMKLREKAGQPAVVMCRAWPGKHIDQEACLYASSPFHHLISVSPYLFLPKPPRSLPLAFGSSSKHPILKVLCNPQNLFSWFL